MKKQMLSVVLVTLGLVVCEAFAVPDARHVRQRYRLDQKRVAANAAKVNADYKNLTTKDRVMDVAVYTVPAMSETMRLPDRYPDDGAFFGEVAWIVAQNEFEPASFLLYSDKDLDRVTVRATDLVRIGGSERINAKEIDFSVVKLWYQGGSGWYGYFADATGRTLVPELLLHDENLVFVDDDRQDYYLRYENEDGDRRYAWMSSRFEVSDYKFDNQANQSLIKDAATLQPFVLNKNEFKQIFATLRIGKGQPSGLYKGKIEILAGNQVVSVVDMKVRVLPFELPAPRAYHDHDRGFYLCLYGTATRNPKIMKNLVDHNCLTPMGFPEINPLNPGALDRDIALAKEYGLLTKPAFFGVESVGLAIWGKKESDSDKFKLSKLKNAIQRTRDLSLAKLGHTDFFSYAIDEGGPRAIKAERAAWRIAHDAGGKIGVTSFAWRELLFALDLLIIPGMPVERRQEEVRLFHDSNPDAMVGWYANPHCGPENPDYFRRIHGLTAWKAGYDVSLNYCWWRNNWNDMAVPYEPNLRAIVSAYGASDDVIDTLAWEGIREGLDDIRYATKARELALKAAHAKDGDIMLLGRRVLSFIAYWDAYRSDPEAFKLECINYILMLDEALKSSEK